MGKEGTNQLKIAECEHRQKSTKSKKQKLDTENGTSSHIGHKGVKQSPQVKRTRMKIDDPDYRFSNDSDDSNDDDTNFIPEDDSSIVADDSSEDTPSCPKKTLGKLTRKNCPHR